MFTVLTILCYYHCVIIGYRSPHALHYLLSRSFFGVELLLLVETTLSLGPFPVVYRRRTVILQATPIRQRVVPLTMVVRLAVHAAM